jgi:hypothetical protein
MKRLKLSNFITLELGMVVHISNPSIWEVEAGR